MAQQIIIKGTPVVAANEVLVADSNSKIPAVDGSAVTAMAGGNIAGTIPTARLDTGTAANKLVVLTGSGLPAVDGSLLTGVSTSTKSASDPTVSTNPSTGVGTEWINHTTGKQFILTDATAGANVWTCSGGGSGNIDPWAFQGSSYGYATGGGSPLSNVIDKYSYTSDANATDVGDLTYATQGNANSRSITHGYQSGGETQPRTAINKWSFSSDGNATTVGTLTVGRGFHEGTASGSYCYWHGGTSPYLNVIDKNSVSTDGNASDVGDLAQARDSEAAASSTTYGYTAGGGTPSRIDMVERYSFASDGNGVDTTQNLLGILSSPSGWASSTTHAYVAGGYTGSTLSVIQKYQFDTSNHSTNVGDLTAGPNSGQNRNGGGTSATNYGYRHGGWPSYRVEIEKWSFASDGDGVDVADLTVGREEMSGTQA